MVSWLEIVLPVVLMVVSGVADDHLSDFLRTGDGTSLEQQVVTVRDVLIKRVRCGVQQGFTKTQCQECLSTKNILSITRGSTDTNRTVIQDLSRMSTVFLNYFLSFETSCSAESVRYGYVGSCKEYEQCQTELQSYLTSMMNNMRPREILEALEKVLREVKTVFEPETSKPCFNAEMVLNELNSRTEVLESLSREAATVLVLTSHLYSGECIDVGESVEDFLDDIFLHYGDGCNRVMTQSGFNQLWNDLQMRRRGKHINHGVQNSCNPGQQVPESTENRDSLDTTKTHKDTTASTVIDQLNTFRTDENNHVPTVTEENEVNSTNFPFSKNKMTSTVSDDDMIVPTNISDTAWGSKVPANSDLYLVDEEITSKEKVDVITAQSSISKSRPGRHMPFPDDHEHKNLANECLPSDDLLQKFLTPGNQLITSSAFLQLCPALVQQVVSGVCTTRLKVSPPDTIKSNETSGVQLQVASQSSNLWYAVASVSLITAASAMGLFFLPMMKKTFFVLINAFFMGLSFGTMSGDVMLHIMPQYLGLHRHDDHDHESETMLERLFPSHLQRQLVFLLTMYVLFLVESIFTGLTDGEQVYHGHSHGSIEIPLKDLPIAGDIENEERKPKLPRCSRIVEFLKPSNLLAGMSSKIAVILLADTVHNFADGMAIAAGYATSYKDGVSTSIAVFFHELPHEIGDFALLMNCGLSFWKAFFFNMLSGLFAFLGLGIGIFSATLFREWLLCITAGLFFFVVMGEMLPDMRLESRKKLREFLIKVLGTVLGITTMIGIAMYELYST